MTRSSQKQKPPAQAQAVRLDKWLWAARFYKTRAIARDMVQGGKVHYNNQRTKPSKVVELGATLVLMQGQEEKTIIIECISDQRRDATHAQTLYRETEQSIAKRELDAQKRKINALLSPKPDTKPDKKQRRQIIQFKNS